MEKITDSNFRVVLLRDNCCYEIKAEVHCGEILFFHCICMKQRTLKRVAKSLSYKSQNILHGIVPSEIERLDNSSCEGDSSYMLDPCVSKLSRL